MVRLVLDVSLHGILSDILVNQIRLFEDVLATLWSWHGYFTRTNAHFKIKVIMRNSSVKHSSWFTTKTRVVRCVVVKDRNDDINMPQWFFLACLNIQCLFDWRMWAFNNPNSLHVLCCGVLSSNPKDATDFFNYVRDKGWSVVRTDCR